MKTEKEEAFHHSRFRFDRSGCASISAFDGSSTKNEDSYQLDVKTMNGTDTHTLELKQGDTLKN